MSRTIALVEAIRSDFTALPKSESEKVKEIAQLCDNF
jgi:hypothetical protein